MKNARFLLGVFLIFIFSIAASADLSHDTEETLDILFTNGRVLDGTGNPCFYADVGIKNGKIAAVGRLKEKYTAEKVIDITGKILSPGFIDIHCHAYDSARDEKSWAGKNEDLYEDIIHNLNWRGEAKNIIVMDHPDKSYIGKSLYHIAKKQHVSDVEMVIKLQMDGYAKMPGGARLRGFSMSEIDIEAFSAQPWTATSSDASIALPGDGPVHARFYGTFPRKIGHYALKRKAISLENAVRASTSLPEQIIGLRDRGMIREGFHADVVVFDPETIKDKATFFEPHQYAEGISHVLVNGVFVVDDGKLTWKKPGNVLTNGR